MKGLLQIRTTINPTSEETRRLSNRKLEFVAKRLTRTLFSRPPGPPLPADLHQALSPQDEGQQRSSSVLGDDVQARSECFEEMETTQQPR
jgi:hypothetical protein